MQVMKRERAQHGSSSVNWRAPPVAIATRHACAARHPRSRRRALLTAWPTARAAPLSVRTVKGISVSSTRQLTVGMMKELVR